MHNMGLPTRGAQRYLTVVRVHTAAEMAEVCTLRRVANQLYGRRHDANDDASWTDGLDPASICILVRLGSKPVGTGRIVVNDGNRALSEIDAEVRLPDWLREDGFVEVSRVAIDPDHRSSGIMIAIFREMGRLALELNCRHMVLDAIERLTPIYEKIGGQRLPIQAKHPYSDEPCNVVVVDIRKSLTTVDRRLLPWTYVFLPVLAHHIRVYGIETLKKMAGTRFGLGFLVKRAMGHAGAFWRA
jgi:hypothetical protein